MGHYRFTVDIAAPPELVWDLWTNLDRIQEWVEGISKVTDREGPPGHAGSRYHAVVRVARQPNRGAEG
jgi:uncharacterized protein YndB with AHSA1/START domain